MVKINKEFEDQFGKMNVKYLFYKLIIGNVLGLNLKVFFIV